MSKTAKEFTLEEVARGDGREGRPVYIVFENTVYDLSDSPLWKKGSHMNMHLSGVDLTDQLASAPHFAEVFSQKRVREVGVLRPDQRSMGMPGYMKFLLGVFPSMRRHPHPISVHFPTVYLITALLFLIIHLVFGEIRNVNFELFSFVMLILGVLSTIPAMGTGFLTLWINYRFKKPALVRWKIRMAIILLIAGFLAIILRATEMMSWAFFEWIYYLLMLCLAVLVMALGYLGGQMVFPSKPR